MSKKEQIENADTIEEVAATDTLKPGAGSSGGEGGFARISKSELLSKFMGIASSMNKQDLSAFLTKTLNQVGKEADTVKDTSAANKASVAMKGTPPPSPSAPRNSATAVAAVKEDMEDLLKDQEDISEEFKEKVTVLFEAALTNRLTIETARIEEEFDTKLDAQVTESIDELHEQINKYTDYVASEWMESNKKELEESYRVEATETFIEGMKKLFMESYVDVPEDKLDVIGELSAKVEEMQEELDKVKSEKIELTKVIESAKLEVAFDEVSDGLADTEVEKLKSLAEGIEYTKTEDYTEKLKIVRDQYFKEEKDADSGDTGLINEDAVGNNDDVDDEAVVPAEMKSYVKAISKTVTTG